MKKFLSKKALVVLSVVGVLSLAAAAIAYWTSTGTGTGSATVGSATNWTVGESGSPVGGPLYPDAAIGGANIQTSSYTVTNPGSGSQYLTDVKIKVATSTGAAWSSQADPLKPACTKDDFSVGGQAVGATWTDTALAGDFTAAEAKTTGSVTVEMIDNNANQDNCQGVSVPLHFSAS